MAADVALPRGAALAGRLLNDAGEPVPGMVVSATRFVMTLAGRRPSIVRQGRTDDLGRFRIHSLPAGEYYLDGVPDPLDAANTLVASHATESTSRTRPSICARTTSAMSRSC